MAFVWFLLGMLTMLGILFFAFYMFTLGTKVGGKKDSTGLHLVKNDAIGTEDKNEEDR